MINKDGEKLAAYLFNNTRRKLLVLLYGHPGESFYVNELILRLGGGSGTTQRELKGMLAAGIVTREKRGNIVFYRANEKCPIFDDLKSLAGKMKTSPSTDGDSSAAKETDTRFPLPPEQIDTFCLKHHIKRLSLFGSVLRDDFSPDSDIDVLVEFEAGYVPGFNIINMQDELSGLLGRQVDLRTAGDLSRYFRDNVVKEARVKYAKA